MGALAALVVLFVLFRFRRIWSSLIFSAVTGLGGFILVSMTSAITGISLVPNIFNIAVSVFGGLPGVAGLLFMRLIWPV